MPSLRVTFLDTGAVGSLTSNGDVLPSASGVKQLGSSTLPWWQVNATNFYVPGGGGFDTMAGANAGTLYLGAANATGIILGRAGRITTLLGDLIPNANNTGQLGYAATAWNQVNATFFFVPGGGLFDTAAAGTLHFGDTNATQIAAGRVGFVTSWKGAFALTPAVVTGAASLTLNPGNGNVVKINLVTATNVTAMTLSPGTDGQTIKMFVIQPATGTAATVTGTWTNVRFTSAYSNTATLGKRDVLTFTYDSTAALWFESSGRQMGLSNT